MVLTIYSVKKYCTVFNVHHTSQKTVYKLPVRTKKPSYRKPDYKKLTNEFHLNPGRHPNILSRDQVTRIMEEGRGVQAFLHLNSRDTVSFFLRKKKPFPIFVLNL